MNSGVSSVQRQRAYSWNDQRMADGLPGASLEILKCHVVTTKIAQRLLQFPNNSW